MILIVAGAVVEAFIRLHEKGLIYQGPNLILFFIIFVVVGSLMLVVFYLFSIVSKCDSTKE